MIAVRLHDLRLPIPQRKRGSLTMRRLDGAVCTALAMRLCSPSVEPLPIVVAWSKDPNLVSFE